MSDAQAQEATTDPDWYWLCVVAVDQQPVGALDDEYVRQRARFVSAIGEILSQPRAELGEAVNAAQVAGVELQHVDEIRYRVPQPIWEANGISVEEFVRRVIAQIRAL